VGDIVEVQFTVIAVPISKGRFKMILQLRSLALLNSNFAQVYNSYQCLFVINFKAIKTAGINQSI
jgi:hypothetical protein